MNGLLNAGPCKCPTCTGRDATYATPADYDEALAVLWVKWGSEGRTDAPTDQSPPPESHEAVTAKTSDRIRHIWGIRPRRIRPWKTTGHLYDERTAG